MRAFDLTVSGSLILSGSMKNQDGNSIVSNSAQIGSNISGSLGANAAVIRTLDRTTLSGSLGANADVIRSLNRTTISGSIPQPLATNSSPTFAAGTITGDFSVGGILTAQEVHTEFESASILFTSGSTRFGDDTTDTHRVTGSMDISGSLQLPHGDVTITDNLSVDGTSNLDNTDIDGTLTVDGGNIVFNEDSADQDFRVESNGNTHMLFVDGGNNRVGVGTNGPAKLFHVEGSTGGDFLARIKNIDGSNGEGLGILTNNTAATSRLLHVENSNGRVFTIFNDAKVMIGDGSQQNFSASSGSLHIAQNEPSIRLQDMNHAPGTFCLINANSGAGGLEIIADGNNKNAGSSIDFQVDGGSKMVISGSGQIGMGTSNPSQFLDLTFAGEDGMAINSTNSNATLFLQANGTNKWIIANAPSQHELFISSAATAPAITIKQDGKVGIGTNSPGRLLDLVTPSDAVALNLRMRSADDFSFITFTDHDAGESFIGQIASKRTGNGAGELQFYTSGDNLRMMISNSGDVGIGTNSPDATLDLRGTQKIQTNTVPASIIVGTNDNTDHTAQDSALAIDFRNLSTTNGVAGGLVGLDKDGLELSKILLVTDNHDANTSSIKMFTSTNAAQRTQMVNINNDGVTVGGSASAQRALHVQGTTGMCLSDGDRDRAALLPISPDAANGGLAINIRSGSASHERVRINNQGTVMIGGSLPEDVGTGAGLVIQKKSGQNQMAFEILDDDSTADSNNVLMALRFDQDNNADGAAFIEFQDSAGVIGTIKVNGAGNTAFNDSSDERLKENITDVDDGYLELIKDVKVRNFDWIDRPNSMKKVGVIAQELEKVIPNVVSKGGDDPNKQPYQVSYPTLVPYLIKAVQELSTQVETIKAQVSGSN